MFFDLDRIMILNHGQAPFGIVTAGVKNLILFTYRLLTDEEFAHSITGDELQETIIEYYSKEHTLLEGRSWKHLLNAVLYIGDFYETGCPGYHFKIRQSYY